MMDNYEINFKDVLMFLRLIGGVLLTILIIFTLFSVFYTVKDTEQAVVTTFGKVTSVSDAGLRFKVPFVQKVQKFPVQQTFKMEVGYQTDKDGNISETPGESRMITGDFNIVNVDFFIEYKISDPVKFFYNSDNPSLIIKFITQGAARSVIGSESVDSILTIGKTQIQSEMKSVIQENLELLDIGLMLIDVKVQDSEPPTQEVVSAFKSVENAKQEKETKINNALAYKNEQIPKANADADKIIRSSEAYKEQKINEAKGQVSRLNEMFEEYSKFEDVTKTRMYLETMEKIIPNIETIIDTNKAGNTNNTLYTLPLKPYNN